MTQTVAVTVPQGVGDIWWVHQKLHPHFPSLHYRVLDLGGQVSPIVRRAEPFVRTWPGVAGVSYHAAATLPAWFHARDPVDRVLAQVAEGRPDVGYSVNGWLEDGVPLEQLDARPVARDLPLPQAPLADLTPGRYVLAYASGDTVRHKHLGTRVYTPEQWVRLLDRVYRHAGLGREYPLVLTGAAFDYPLMGLLATLLRKAGYRSRLACDHAPAAVYWLLANCWGFVGYQSGLNVLADNLGTRQLMLYFPSLKRMGDTWVHPARRATHFRWGYFDEDPAAVAERFPPPAAGGA